MKKAGTVTQAEADAAIRGAYQKILDDYPECKAAKAAEQGLRGLATN